MSENEQEHLFLVLFALALLILVLASSIRADCEQSGGQWVKGSAGWPMCEMPQ